MFSLNILLSILPDCSTELIVLCSYNIRFLFEESSLTQVDGIAMGVPRSHLVGMFLSVIEEGYASRVVANYFM